MDERSRRYQDLKKKYLVARAQLESAVLRRSKDAVSLENDVVALKKEMQEILAKAVS